MIDDALSRRAALGVALLPGSPLDSADLDRLVRWRDDARLRAGDAAEALALARDIAPHVGGGVSTATRWSALATIARADLTVARAVEPHLDAQDILATATAVDLAAIGAGPSSTWGVFAAESPDTRLEAQDRPPAARLSGTKPWCSLAGRLSHALVTAHTDRGSRALFAVALGSAAITVRDDAWVARGLSGVPSGPVDFHDVSAVPVGADGWYLERAGFAWGGIGVAAIWWGGALGLADSLARSATTREPDQIALSHLGAVDAALHAAGVSLAHAAAIVDAGGATRSEARILAARTRSIVARAVEETLSRCGHSLGPAPLALDAEHARRVADLTLYVRQHHAERDDAALGRALVTEGAR
ncbi:acyl-CoA dehydrogenase [Marisediminicola sp. LYQ85]|uniref:acyl-CoA dehydrogenase n=1 Tax=Marisediminicola sp. LYQ85 TaxID=3391062 RepID=UPI00398368E8